MKETDAKFTLDDILPVEMRLESDQVDIILRALELYAYNLEYMINGENCTDKERRKKLDMLKHTYESVLSDQAAQVYSKRNNRDNLTPYGQKMLKDIEILNIIPNNKELRAI